MDLSKPLSDQEFEELDEFLNSEDLPDESMDISMLDGFLTAVVIGPNLVMPSQWLPEVWGKSPEQPMNWKSVSQAERMTGLVMRHMNDIIWYLDNDPEHYEPLLYEREHEGQTIPIIDEWCTGFIRGTLLEGEAWEPLFASDDTEGLLLPIILYGTEAGWEELEKNPQLAERHDAFAESLAECVLSIRDYWMQVRKATSTIRHDSPVPGRNDPCPCGSGKKFKRCCGSATRLN